MKTVLLMRHAKSSWKHAEMKDFDRPLNPRGERDAPRMGQVLRDTGLLPELILSSPAVRARSTVEALVAPAGYTGEVRYLASFYMAETPILLDMLKVLPDTLQRVMLVGHNPGLEALLQTLTGEVEALPTAAIAEIQLPVEHWAALDRHVKGKLVQICRPRDLKNSD